MKTKIFEIQVSGEKYWICADKLIEALKTYCSIADVTIGEFEDDDDIIEVPKDKWVEMNIFDTEGEFDDVNGYPIMMTFLEYMRTEATESDIIASTEY